ncbi:MAG: hypothetical protein ACFHU9_12210 [Fluviicola sp.]
MSKLKTDKVLVKDSKLEAKKLETSAVKEFIRETKEKQDFILSLKTIDEKSLKAVVQL